MTLNKKIQSLSPRWNAIIRALLAIPWFLITLIIGIIVVIVVVINTLYQFIAGKKGGSRVLKLIINWYYSWIGIMYKGYL